MLCYTIFVPPYPCPRKTTFASPAADRSMVKLWTNSRQSHRSVPWISANTYIYMFICVYVSICVHYVCMLVRVCLYIYVYIYVGFQSLCQRGNEIRGILGVRSTSCRTFPVCRCEQHKITQCKDEVWIRKPSAVKCMGTFANPLDYQKSRYYSVAALSRIFSLHVGA